MEHPLSYVRPIHPHRFGQVPGTNGQNMAVTWQGPGRTRHPLTITRQARPTGGRVEAAESGPHYRLTRAERRDVAERNRHRQNQR